MAKVSPGGPKPARHYSVSELAVMFVAFAFVVMLLESEGLVTWASRLSLGKTQSALLAVLKPTHRVLSKAGLSKPRKEALQLVSRLTLRLGSPLSETPSDLPDVPVRELRMDPIEVVGLAVSADAPPTPAPAPNSEVAQAEPPIAQAAPEEVVAEPGVEANADPAPEIALGAAPLPVPPVGHVYWPRQSRRRSVLLLGDSMMASGLAGAIVRSLSDEGRFHVVRAYKEATGLSRPDIYNWMEVLPPLLDDSQPRLVVCTLGANDAQRIEEDGEVLEFGTRRWRSVYRERVHALMALLSAHDTEVLWLGLPVMRSTDFTERTSRLNEIYEAESRTFPRVHYLESASAVAGPDGTFATFLTDAQGQLVQLRLDDGVHYARAGGERVASRVVAWIHDQVNPGPVAISAAPPKAPVPSPSMSPSASPSPLPAIGAP